MTTVREELARSVTQSMMSSFFVDKMGIYSVKSYGATGNGATDDYTALFNTSAAADDNGGTMFFPTGTYKIGASITFPSNVTLWFADGAKLSPDTGVTVTISGNIQAGLHQIFTGSGTIASGAYIRTGVVHPEWWGAVSDDVTDCTSAFTNAIAFAKGRSGMKIVAPGHIYKISSITFEGADSYHFVCPGILKANTINQSLIILKEDAGGIGVNLSTFEIGYLWGNNLADAIGLDIRIGLYNKFKIRRVYECPQIGIYMRPAAGKSAGDCTFELGQVYTNGYGIVLGDGGTGACEGNHIEVDFINGNTNSGVWLRSGCIWTYVEGDIDYNGTDVTDDVGKSIIIAPFAAATISGTKINESMILTTNPDVGINGTYGSRVMIGQRLHSSAAGAPIAGTWRVGDVVWNNAPASAGYVGWVCTVAGTPGTWRGFGTIA